MKIAQILRKLADTVEAHEPQQSTGTVAGSVEIPSAHADPDDSGVMVPPLQLKIELLKKAAGVDSIFDRSATESSKDPELDHLRRQAGVVKIQDLASDFPGDE